MMYPSTFPILCISVRDASTSPSRRSVRRPSAFLLDTLSSHLHRAVARAPVPSSCLSGHGHRVRLFASPDAHRLGYTKHKARTTSSIDQMRSHARRSSTNNNVSGAQQAARHGGRSCGVVVPTFSRVSHAGANASAAATSLIKRMLV